ncbi:MAG TPA: hypothetical protein VK598_08155, partial [Nitrospiraceae bacterium]|nr:hypothetical protein [Nitrospiraceae bacterium]
APCIHYTDHFDIERTMDNDLLRAREAADFLSVTALAAGWNCTARVDCGKQKLTTIQEEGKS